MKNYLILMLAVLVFGCNNNKEFTTPSGVKVTRHIVGDGEGPTNDSIVVLQLKIAKEDGEAITETTASRPLAMAFSDTVKAGNLQEVLIMLNEGDSVTFSTTAYNLFQETYKRPIPEDLDSTSRIDVFMKFQEEMTRSAYGDFAAKLREKAMAEQLIEDQRIFDEKMQEDGDSLDQYLAAQGIEPMISESGLRYVITKEGNGVAPVAGDKVSVHYTGKLLSGDKFDSSLDRGEPFSFVLGRGNVIKAWDEGIAYVKKGGKATLYVPSPLGYGARGAGPQIGPHSILVFDVEVVDVEKSDE